MPGLHRLPAHGCPAARSAGELAAVRAVRRYKMPKLAARIEGRGNGIKTNVVNCVDIAKALERPPDCEPRPPRVPGVSKTFGRRRRRLRCCGCG